MTQEIYTATIEQRLAWLHHKIAILSQKIPPHMILDKENNIDYKYSYLFKELHKIAQGLNIK